MLEVLNRYCHGLTVIPIIDALRRAGCLARIEKMTVFEAARVGEAFGANPAYFAAALRMLACLGWVTTQSAGEFLVTSELANYRLLPANILDLYAFSFRDYIGARNGASLADWIALSAERWRSDHSYWPDFMDGAFVVPLLLALRDEERIHADDARLQLDLEPDQRQEVEQLFVARRWAEKSRDGLRITRVGQFIVNRIPVTAVTASYRPMLSRAHELLFGDARRVFDLDGTGRETHVDRTLNVHGSGFQHEKYFAELEELVLDAFAGESYDAQPTCIADTGCGDGSLLKRLHNAVRTRTSRGSVLDRHPLQLIAIDYNDEALQAAARTLEGLAFTTLKGDVGNPQQIQRDLIALGIEADRVLHVRSFLDHDRPFTKPQDAAAAAERAQEWSDAVYIDGDARAIAPTHVVQSTAEHLQRWADILNGHGLIALEVHGLATAITASHLDESESFHFDACQSMSRQYLLEAHAFAECAANAGLLCDGARWMCFPKHLPFTRMTLHHFKKRPYAVRRARERDASALAKLDVALADGLKARECFVIESKAGEIVAAVMLPVKTDVEDALILRTMDGDEKSLAHVTDLLAFVERYCSLKHDEAGVAAVARCRRSLAASSATEDSLADRISPGVLSRALRRRAPRAADVTLAEQELAAFAFRYVLSSFQSSGLLLPDSVCEEQELRAQLRVLPKYHAYFSALLRGFEKRELIVIDGPRIRTTAKTAEYVLPDPAAALAEFEQTFPARHAIRHGMMRLTTKCLAAYRDILSGDIDAAAVAFPEASMELFEGLFKGDAVADYFSRAVADAVRSAVRALRRSNAGRTVRVLELGGGTGGTTAAVLRALRTHSGEVSFCFSDLSPAFLRHAERSFGRRYPGIEYRVLDIDDDRCELQAGTDAFDIIVVANVLHDTRNIDATLARVRKLLTPGGVLILDEYTAVKECLLFSGALLHGAWLFEDPEKRLPDFCLLDREQWRAALTRAGFTLASCIGLPDEMASEVSGETIMLCQPESVARALAPARERDTEANVAVVVDRHLREILGPARVHACSPTRPLMELGLDSIELVELKSAVARHYGLKLPPTFLFEHETQQKLARAVAGMIAPGNDRKTAQPNKKERKPESSATSIAVVGIACRLPGGAITPRAFWALLKEGRDGIVSLPQGRWEWPASVDPMHSHPGIDRGGFLARVDEFDPLFFRISPQEASLMDPQHRLMLELGWEVLEDAGYTPSGLADRRVGVFCGVCQADYRDVVTQSGAVDAYAGLGNAASMLANRLSYYFDLKGPSVVVDTACSSSLFALHEAVTALRRGDCDAAIVGAANIMCSPTNTVSYYQAGMLSPSGACRTLDDAADGYVRGEGGVALLLKPLTRAVEDGDSIYGLIAGTAVNHGGQASTLTAPKPEAQTAVIRQAWRDAGRPIGSASYMEMHGTGTKLGDPVEVSGLIGAFADGASARKERCGVGSVKSNVGHLEAAAGLAGVLKVLLALKHQTLPGTLHLRRMNPHIDLSGSPFYAVTEAQRWEAPRDEFGAELPRRAGVSSFGFGGANAHCVIEEYRADAVDDVQADCEYVVPLSARDTESLAARVRQLLDYLQESQAGSSAGALLERQVFAVLADILRRRFGMSDADVVVAHWDELGWSADEARLFASAIEEDTGVCVDARAFMACGTLQALAAMIAKFHASELRLPAVSETEPTPQQPGSDECERLNLRDLAYTLQVGREPMTKRVTFIVRDLSELEEELRAHLAGTPVTSRGDAADSLRARASQWIAGEDVDWQPIRATERRQRLHLPVYPFTRQRCWVAAAAPIVKPATAVSKRSPVSARDDIEATLVREIAAQLRLPETDVDIAESFSTYGLDSIGLPQLTNRLNEMWGLRLTPTLFFERPNVRACAEFLLEHHAATFTNEARVSSTQPIEPLAAPAHEPVAIIGVSCRLPGATDFDGFWEVLRDGKDCVTEVLPSRWDWHAVFGDPAREPNKTRIRWGAFIEGVNEFDAAFFGLSRREAEAIDPQQRLLLMHAWHALEDAGYSPRGLAGSRTGVFIGIANMGYGEMMSQAGVPIEGYSTAATLPSIGANRISYLLDLHGPSEPVETACSSSLVAIHRAVRALRDGDCNLALTGGVNLMLTPAGHIGFGKAGMLSEDGRCKTFSKDANGYVRGEGVGILVLKPLSAAERDGDHIYGLIRGSSENHGGRANSLTSPNPAAHADLITAAWTQAGVDPRSAGYIEAHGTGTPLGDPIEITGLSSAFERLYAQHDLHEVKAHCGVGSVKTAIGHLEIAAGVAGVIKVLLQFRHQTLARSLHCDAINPYIQLEGTPLYIVQRSQPWAPIRDDKGHEWPRRAGVSSFGFGGVNAHVVLEEYVPPSIASVGQSTAGTPALIVLSARTARELSEQVRQLQAVLEGGNISDNELESVAFTLQVGRAAMEHRLAVLVHSVAELGDRLTRWARGEQNLEHVWSGQTAGSTKTEVLPLDLFEPRRYFELGQRWVRGGSADWSRLYRESCPRRLSLPGYPFAMERYWISTDSRQQITHPLLARHAANGSGTRFTATFTGDEFFLRDHTVRGVRTLPGVAYLEMAREALAQVLVSQAPISLKDHVWLRPVAVEGHRELTLALELRENARGGYRYEIVSEVPGEEGGTSRRVHAEGRAQVITDASLEQVDLAELRATSTRVADSTKCYEAFNALGIGYGPAHRGLLEVRSGADSRGDRFLLAEVELPDCVRNTGASYVLHPAVLDAAFQSTLAWGELGELRVPFLLEEVQVLSRCPDRAHVLVRQHGTVDGTSSESFDIDVMDGEGRLCVRLLGLSTRAVRNSAPEEFRMDAKKMVRPAEGAETSLTGTVMMMPSWQVAGPAFTAMSPEEDAHVLLVGGTHRQREQLRRRYARLTTVDVSELASPDVLSSRLGALKTLQHVIWIAPPPADVDSTCDGMLAAQEAGVLCCFRLVKMLQAGHGSRPLGWTVVTWNTQATYAGEFTSPAHASVHGFIGSVAKEFPRWSMRVVDLSAATEWPLDDVLRLPAHSEGMAWAWRHGEWYTEALLPCALGPPSGPQFKRNGVYVIFGGSGGIGEVFTEYLLRNYAAHVIWIGRRKRDLALDARLDRLASFGPRVEYIRADATRRDELERARETIRQHHAHIDGLVHATLVLADQSVARMDEQRFFDAFTAKAHAAVRASQVFECEKPELVLMFSSMQTFITAAGQSNYAAGCAFVDAYASHLYRTWPATQVKVMNWGYWGRVGAVASDTYRQRMARQGFGSLEPEVALQALEVLVDAPCNRLLTVQALTPLCLRGISTTETVTRLPSERPRTGEMTAISSLPKPLCKVDEIELSRGREELDSLYAQLLLTQLRALGLGEHATVSAWKRHIGMPELYERWLVQSLKVLARRGLLRFDGDVVVLAGKTASPDSWSLWQAQKPKLKRSRLFAGQVDLVESMLRALPNILTRKTLATEVMFPGSSLSAVEGVYKDNELADYFHDVLAWSVANHVRSRGQQAKTRLLEVGAGTGSTSERVFAALAPMQSAVAEYCYTDLSRAFLLHAERRFKAQAPYLVTKRYDLEREPTAQGLEANRYDVVIAANVLHATKDIRRTLRQLKAAMKPGGLLVLNEISGSPLFAHLTFGLLEGWWLFQDAAVREEGSPALSAEAWARVLTQEGFVSIAFPAESSSLLGQQIITCQSDGLTRHASKQGVASSTPNPRAAQAAASVEARPPSAHKLNGTTPPKAGEPVAAALRKTVADVLKVDERSLRDDVAFADYGVDSIVAVNLVNEINTRFGTTLPTTVLFDYPNLAKLSAKVGERPGLPKSAPAAAGERIATARVTPVRKVLIERPGSIEDLKIVSGESPPLMAGQLRIAVHAFALNFADLLCVKGLYPSMPEYPFTPGFEVSGVISEVGPSVDTLNVGEAVIAVMGHQLGGQATHVVCPVEYVVRKPASLSFTEACSLPVVGMTMIEVIRKADIRRGERVLIQTATGGVGLMAVQFARHYGAEIYATAGSAHKVEHLRSLGVRHAINYREVDFQRQIAEWTDGKGVDVVINTLAGDAIQKGLNCLASGGRYIEIAMTALKSARGVDLSGLMDNQSFCSIDLRRRLARDPSLVANYMQELLAMVDSGAVKPTLGEVLPLSDVQAAYRKLEDRANIGKVVVSVVDHVTTARPVIAAPKVPPTIAVVGMSGRFANAGTLDALWDALSRGEDLTTDVSRWDAASIYSDPDEARHGCPRGGFLRDIDCFDPEFFNISAAEAAYMDPQQRLFIEEAWHALEMAGHAGNSIEGKQCGVYVGCGGGDYAQLFDHDPPAQAFWGNAASVVPARIAYHLNLKGAAISVDTACSSSLVAIHMACKSLLAGEVDMALAGGAFVQCTPVLYVSAGRARMVSPTGKCSAFDDRADGFVPGEGVGVVLLKRLDDALRDGDTVYGVIRASGVNQDGATNGFTAPSAQSQESLQRSVYEAAGIRPRQIQMVETHGTGTRLGDPVEFHALSSSFRSDTGERQFCALGSIKASIGHTAYAAGVAGVLKVLLSFQHRKIPPSLNFAVANAEIDFENSPFFVNTKLRDWNVASGTSRLAAVSSFGFSGTNAHVLIEEGTQAERVLMQRPWFLFAVSARKPEQLRTMVASLIRHCRLHTELNACDVAFTLATGRRHFEYRVACVARNLDHLCELLERWLGTGGEGVPHVYSSPPDHAREPARISMQRLIGQCIQECGRWNDDAVCTDHLQSIAEAYAQGYALDYSPMFSAGGCRRIALPTYPFARRRYWMKDVQDAESAVIVAAAPPAEIYTDGASATSDRILRQVQRRTAEILEMDEAALHSGARPFEDVLLGELGMDSLMSASLRDAISADFGVTLSVQQILGERVRALVATIQDELLLLAVSGQQAAAPGSNVETYVF